MPVRALLLAAVMFAAGLPSAGLAHEYRLGSLLIVHPHAASYVAGRPVVVYMTIANDGAVADRLVEVHAPTAERAELHTHELSQGVMSMKKIGAIEIPARGEAALRQGGFHIMLFNLARPVAVGDRIPLVLEFEAAGRIEVEAEVEKPADAGHMHGHSETGDQQ